MALTVSAPVAQPSLTVGSANNPTLTPGVISATPGSNGFIGLPQPAKAVAAPAAQPAANPATDPYAAILAAIKATQQVQSPIPDVNAIYGKAQARANSEAGDYYNKSINDFMSQQAQQQATQQAIEQTNIQNAQDVLKQTQQANTVAGNRTTQDTATKEAQAAQATDWRQTDQGGQYDIDRVAQAIQQAKSGIAGPRALGEQSQSQADFNTKESRQATQDQQTQQATELAKARTFEDLATSNTNAASAEAKGEQAAKFDLSSFTQQQGIDLVNKQQQLKIEQANQAAQIQQNQVAQGFRDFYGTISNPAQQAAYMQAYGKFL